MNTPVRLLISSLVATCTISSIQAQTVADFEDVSLPGADTTYLHTQMANGNGIYSFQSGFTTFYGEVFYDVYWGGFNCSNVSDNTNLSFTNDAASIVGSGVDSSAQYVVSFVGTDFMGPDPSATIPNGVKLNGNAVGKMVAGVYVTNTAYTYGYITDNNHYATNQYYYQLIVRGYENGIAVPDSVVVSLADFTDTNQVVLTDWTWVDLTSLGQVDSLTFDVSSNDAGQFGINTPTYFALDNLITLDNGCPGVEQLTANDITDTTVLITWQNEVALLTTTYEIAIDESPTLAPTANVESTNSNEYGFDNLMPNTLYYVHLRAACDDGTYSDWDTLSFHTTMPSGIEPLTEDHFQVSISPNPASHYLTINASEKLDAVIFSVEGKQIARYESVRRIDISRLASGIYFIKLRDAKLEQSRTLRFVKQ